MERYTPEEKELFGEINSSIEGGDPSRIKELFDFLDRNHNGVIEAAELKLIYEDLLCQKVSDEYIEKNVKELDLNKNGVVDFYEFALLMEEKSKRRSH
ncbi:hypothetical protein SteCoe_21079 [Stentor coeruleus]|uniref:EF-hand domain-containing protein n=1 Tax=Stentor coeruleus TaxID=5963 RepID=A0A1R2BQJ2_9CILI|nr:hypothetical protein SteCoe_21079 [Stentor coeruleus]